MINLFHKRLGAATLIITVILLVVATLIIIFGAEYSKIQQKITQNYTREAQAFQAAEAGMEFAINYLQKNSATILANPVSGFIPTYADTNTTNITLANNSKFSVVYNNPVANNYNLILITSTGTCDDGTSTRIISQRVQRGSLLLNFGSSAVTSKGDINLSGNAIVENTITNNTVQSGESITLSGSSQTHTSSGGSTPSSIGADIQANVSSLDHMSENNFFANYFGTTSTSAVQAKMANIYTNSSNTNYSSTLNGKTGTTIWINQTGGTEATINGTTSIGTSTNPVLLIVNGKLKLAGNVTIYGFIYVLGTTGINPITGNINLIGSLASTEDFNISGSSTIQYSSSVISNLQNQSSMLYYAKVPGSWKDF